MRRIPGTIGLALGLLVAGCGGTGTPEPPASLATGTATTASAVEPPAGSTAPSSATRSAASASRTAGSSSSAARTTGKPPPRKSTPAPTTAKPPAKGSPLRSAPIEIIGTSYAALGPVTEAQLKDECGGTLCVTMLVQVEGPPDPDQDCTVKRIIQSVPIYRGDTITFVLSDPCGDFTEPSPAG